MTRYFPPVKLDQNHQGKTDEGSTITSLWPLYKLSCCLELKGKYFKLTLTSCKLGCACEHRFCTGELHRGFKSFPQLRQEVNAFINTHEAMCNSRKCLRRDMSHQSENKRGRQNTVTRDGPPRQTFIEHQGRHAVSHVWILSNGLTSKVFCISQWHKGQTVTTQGMWANFSYCLCASHMYRLALINISLQSNKHSMTLN